MHAVKAGHSNSDIYFIINPLLYLIDISQRQLPVDLAIQNLNNLFNKVNIL